MHATQVKPVRKHKTFKSLLKIYGSGLFMGFLVMVIAYQFVKPAPPKVVTIATANADGAYYAYAELYKQKLAKEKIELQILETSGSVENLKLLAEKNVDLAFLQGGIGSEKEYPELQGLASLYLEPLWIFVKKGLAVTSIQDLIGKRVAIGPEGSGTRQIAMQLLADNNLADSDHLELLSFGGSEGAEELFLENIDALFLVTRAETPLVRSLYLDPRVELVNLVRAESYTRLHKYLSHIVLPIGVLDIAHNIPDQELHLIAPAATLVTNNQLHPALIDLLMQITTAVHKDGSFLTSVKKFPSPENLDFPLSKEAERFYQHGPPFLQRYLPFWAASLIDRLKIMALPLVALILPLSKVLPPTYQWRMRSRIYRWYDELHELDLYSRENASREVITSAMATLDAMEHDVRLVEVPLSYSEELYNLRLHIELLRNQLGRLADGETNEREEQASES
ncbi:MAG: TAXI family TRAP transporter solute-binding subunit [Desulforhopalus sp.]